MKAQLESLVPNITTSIIQKVLLLEIYFLLRAGKSPAYFSLTDFVDNYSIELFYIAVFFSMLAAWLVLPAMAVYMMFAGILAWCTRKFFGIFKYLGVPIFKILDQHEQENSVSIEIAKDYAKFTNDASLKTRIEEHEEKLQDDFLNETQATINFALIIAIIWISNSTSAPNFFMQVANLVDPFTFGWAYQICVLLLVLQGIVGRMVSFHIVRSAGSLPIKFFQNDEERETVAAHTSNVVEQKMSAVWRWLAKP